MGRPLKAAEALDYDTVLVLRWAATNQETRKLNIRDWHRELRKSDQLQMSISSLYKAMTMVPVSEDVHKELEDTIALNGWRGKFRDWYQMKEGRRSLGLFQSTMNFCRVCQARCACCGEPGSEARRQALVKRKFPDPQEFLRDHPDAKPLVAYD